MSHNTSPPPADDMKLVEAIYERHKGIMYKTALETLRDPAGADDVIQDAILRLARCAETLRGLDDRARAVYAANTVHSAALDHLRRALRERGRTAACDAQELERIPADADPEAQYIERETRDARLAGLRQALDELSPTDRALLVGYYLNGESADLLAGRLGLKPSTIRTRVARAKRRVRDIILRKEGGHGNA